MLFPVYFYAYEILVQQRGDFLIFKRLFFQYMAPVTSGVAYAQKNGLVLILRSLECLFTPCVPMDRVVLVLQ